MICLIQFRFGNGETRFISAQNGENLLKAAKRAGIALYAPCSGTANCGKCRVRIISGSLLSPPCSIISEKEYAEGWRLACEACVCGDVCLQVD